MKKYVKPEVEEVLKLSEQIMDDILPLSEDDTADLDAGVGGIIQIKFG